MIKYEEMKKRSGSYGLCTTFICRISIIQGHVSLRFSCENFTYYKYYLQGFRNVKVTFQQISVAETVHTPSFLNKFCVLKLFGIAKFQQVSVDGNRLEFGTP